MISKRSIYGALVLGFAFLSTITAGVLFFRFLSEQPAQPSMRSGPDTQDVGLLKNPDGSYRLPANNEGWYPIGRGSFTIEVKGSIDFGGTLASPDRSPIMGNAEALVPGVPFGVPVGKIGEHGKPFMVGYSHRFQTVEEMAYIAVNDSYYGDNKGSYIIYKR